MNLDTFEAAYDRACLGSDPTTAGPPRLRRRLGAPRRDLIGTILLLLVTLTWGIMTANPIGYLLAAGSVLTVLPRRRARLRKHQRAIAAVESPGDLRDLWIQEARRASSKAFGSFVVYGVLGLSFLATGLVAWLVGKSPAPGLAAGVVVLCLSAVARLWFYPAAAREARLFGEDDQVDAGEEQEVSHGS